MTSVTLDETNITPVFVDVSKKSSEDVRKFMLEYWKVWVEILLKAVPL